MSSPESSDPPHRPIACSLHDVIEAAATRRDLVRLTFVTPDGEERETEGRIVDVGARDGAEYLRLSTGTEVRLDRLLRLGVGTAPHVDFPVTRSSLGRRPFHPRGEEPMKITVETLVNAEPKQVWDAWTTPADIVRWNAASDDWHTTRAGVDLRVGGTFSSRMEAKDGSAGFDFVGTFTRVTPLRTLAYRMEDGREVEVEFVEREGGVLVKETFDAESVNPAELQRQGWQAILDSFRRHVESR